MELLAAETPQHWSLHYGPCIRNSDGLQVFISPFLRLPLTPGMCRGRKGHWALLEFAMWSKRLSWHSPAPGSGVQGRSCLPPHLLQHPWQGTPSNAPSPAQGWRGAWAQLQSATSSTVLAGTPTWGAVSLAAEWPNWKQSKAVSSQVLGCCQRFLDCDFTSPSI